MTYRHIFGNSVKQKAVALFLMRQPLCLIQFILFLFGEQCFDFCSESFEEVAHCRKAFLQSYSQVRKSLFLDSKPKNSKSADSGKQHRTDYDTRNRAARKSFLFGRRSFRQIRRRQKCFVIRPRNLERVFLRCRKILRLVGR